MKFNEAIEEARLFTKWSGFEQTKYSPDWTEFAHEKMKGKNKNIQYAQDTVHYKDYMKTLKSGGKKPYLTWVNNMKTKM